MTGLTGKNGQRETTRKKKKNNNTLVWGEEIFQLSWLCGSPYGKKIDGEDHWRPSGMKLLKRNWKNNYGSQRIVCPISSQLTQQ